VSVTGIEGRAMIATTDRRLRVFVSSTRHELAEERAAVRRAIEELRLTPIMFEAGARNHSPQEVYRSYVDQSDVFVGIYGRSSGWSADPETVTGLEEELSRWEARPRLVYVKQPAPGRDPRLPAFLDAIRDDRAIGYRPFTTPEELGQLVGQDLALLLSENFLAGRDRAPLPSGTVTFLFTDIERSTYLLRQLGDAYVALLADHHRLIRDALARGGGVEVDTAGDGFFVAFDSASAAVRTAVEAQRAMARHEWPEHVAVRVRMGLHTGDVAPVNGRYVGLDVHRAARIANAGHGGQILVSAATARLAQEDGEVGLIDLGHHRLKDLPGDEHIYQVAAAGLDDRFPSLQSMDAARTNLLDKTSSFVGREREVDELSDLVRANRLVTLTGPGGTGKTRLAVRVAKTLGAELAYGVWAIPLAQVTSESAIPQAALDALGLHEQPGRALEDTLIEYLERGSSLVLIDNCEHLLTGAARLIARILERCPHVSALATSREPLRVAGEVVFPVPALTVPGPDVTDIEELEKFDSIRLFVERACATGATFGLDAGNAADVATLTRQLDGIPLALELAAARIGSLSVGQIVKRLQADFELLQDRGGTTEARHRTLRAAVEWSHDLLTHPEQVVLRRLSVFRGTFDLDAAEHVAAGGDIAGGSVVDLIATLVERSLVVAERGTGGYRYRLLQVVRHYAAERLTEADEEAATRDRQAEWVARQVGPAMWPSNPALDWYMARATDNHNIEAAHDWLLESGRTAAALEMAVALGWYWYNQGYWTEGRARVASSLALPDGDEPLDELRAHAHVVASLLAFRQGDYRESLVLAHQAEELAGETYRTAATTARTARALGLISDERLDEATELVESVLTRARVENGDWFVGAVCIVAGRAALARGEFTVAESFYYEAAVKMDAADDRWALATAWEGVGEARLYRRDTAGAAKAFVTSLDSNPIADAKASIATALLGACLLDDDPARAQRLIDDGSAVIFRRRDWVGRTFLIAGVVPALVRHGLVLSAQKLIETDLTIARSGPDPRGRCRSLAAAARFFAGAGDHERAAGLAAQLLDARTSLGEDRHTATALWVACDVLLARGATPTAARLFGAADRALARARPTPLPIEEMLSGDLHDRLASALGAEAMTAETEAGAQMTLDEALREARAALASTVEG
jgi:predicted ATPase/class 3 adenylate cyclase